MNIQIRKSRVLKKMRSGKTAICVKLNLSDPKVVEIAGIADFDCVWLDMEHVPTDWNSIENQIRAAKLYDTDVVVRVSKGSYSDMIKPLEADATGIMYPHLMNLEEARKLVYMTKFYPVGRRPIDGGNADGKFCLIDIKEYTKSMNRERFVMAQIEDPEAMEEVEEIIKLDGIDMIFFGPGDFSQGIGDTGNIDHPKVTEVRKTIAKLCRKHNRFSGTLCTPDNFKEFTEMGYSFISVGADVVGLGNYMLNLRVSLGT